MSKLLLFGFGNSLWEYVTVLFDNVPKIIYLIYASVASCLDVLQHVMKKLAGLDTYWVNGSAVVQQDPILEFIYGMLGIGKNAGSYYALNTVFWSLVIFAAIVLLVSTMIAIIKSHYGEDSNKTNPITYVFTAVKAIFTFMITPVAVILGIYLSQFLLQTLDNITAGSVTEDTLKGIYGSNAGNIFQGSNMDGTTDPDHVYYGYYDYFSLGSATSSTTFSGMMFKAAAYNANRARINDTHSAQGLSHKFFTDNNLLGGAFSEVNPPSRPSGMSDDDWLAYQIDFAFANNLHLKGGPYWVMDLYDGWDAAGKAVITISSVDIFSMLGIVKSFSKYNVGLVWYFYRLWDFNFFVGFASIIVSLGLLVSIIIGLMSRLIQSAAMFMIFPPLLGLAPMDEFNAFKKWRQKFMSYVLMAFGAIVGMNLFFLIMPYVNEIQWFGTSALWGVINSIINTLIIIVGLISVKAFIAFCSELIGAADAFTTGDGLKGELKGTLAKTGGAVLGAANVGMKVAGLGPLQNALKSTAGMTVGRIRNWNQQRKINNNQLSDAERDQAGLNVASAGNNMETERNALTNTNVAWLSSAEHRNFAGRATAMGLDPNSAEYKEMELQAKDAYLTRTSSSFRQSKSVVDNEGLTDNQRRRQQVVEEATERQKLIREAHHFGTDPATGRTTINARQVFGSTWKDGARDFGGAFLKMLQGGLKDLNINIGMKDGLGSILSRGTNLKVDGEGKVVGKYGAPGEPGLISTIGNAFKALPSALFAPNNPHPPKPASSDDKLATAAQQMDRAANAIVKAAEKLNRYHP